MSISEESYTPEAQAHWQRNNHEYVPLKGTPVCAKCGCLYDAPFHQLPDTGARVNYTTGATREADPNKPAVEGISPFAAMRLGMLMTRANAKYGDYRNWEKGIPVTRYIGGILRHTFLYLARDKTEDHLAAIMWNAMCLIHHEEVGSTSGKTFADLDDRPKWKE